MGRGTVLVGIALAIAAAMVAPAAWADTPAVRAPVVLSDADAAVAASCAEHHRLSLCFAPSIRGEVVAACIERCIDGIDAAENRKAAEARDRCEQRFVAEQGKKVLACGLGPASSVREDEKKLTAAFAAAVAARSQELDAIAARVFAVDLASRERKCSTDCNTRGRSRMRAPVEGPGLVRQFKQCMVKADTTREARKLALFERDLYQELIDTANTRCREASKCDWLEEFSSLECTYSPL